MQNALDEIFAKLEGPEVASIVAATPSKQEEVQFVGSGKGLEPKCETIEPQVLAEPGRIDLPALMKTFVLAGNATFTLRSKATGTRYTYKVKVCKNNPNLYFVSVMYGSDNENEYAYLGTIRKVIGDETPFAWGRKSPLSKDDVRVRSFSWFWTRVQLQDASLVTKLEFWHEGRCCRCGRSLTVPESIASGIGPECLSKMGF